ncbi:MAG: bifunctional acetate--CoA ligase family protein/GNAT family N-acetyltransferase [Hyphomonadaceae bacterium]|nr:bifunctional acetate--CoA ligase family protein/GNAT family N-acetyltransferase [Hyphomonadaceae bacterium]
MTTRNFDALFAARSLALIGASNRPGSVGAVIARNLFGGGFEGSIATVNPREETILGRPSCRSIADLPDAPDLAIIATPAPTIPDLVAQLAARGCRAAVVISAGFSDGDLRQRMLAAARPNLMRLLGPNSLGFLSPARGINASFSHLTPKAGKVALLSQSGAVLTAMLDWAVERGIGFSHILSLGDMSDIDFGDALDFLALDHATDSILLYIESITQARKFMSAARIAARIKPVIAIKAGRSASGARAAASHTGALAGADAVYDAAIRRAGMLRVKEVRDLFDAAETLAAGMRVNGDRLAILTNGGGLGVLAADALEESGGRLAALSPQTIAALDKALPRTWSHGNPIDIIGDADGPRYDAALAALTQSREQDAILVMNCPTGIADSMDAARAVIARRSASATPLLTCWMGEATAKVARRAFSEAHIPTYDTPDEAVRAFTRLVDYAKNQAALMETPRRVPQRPSDAPGKARAIIAAVLQSGRTLLTEPEAKALLAAYGVPTVATFIAATPEEAAARADEIGQPAALKILSPDITHKSDVGGVRLNLRDGAAVRTAASDMLARVKAVAPAARIDGFTVQAMISRPGAKELLLGVSSDPTFGPVLMFGQGGTAVEVIADRALALPPLNSALADALVSQTRIAKLLRGYRDVPPADMNAIVGVLLALSDMACECPEIAELDINPLLADADGVLALDARVVVRAEQRLAEARLAIRPYPAELERDLDAPDGGLRLRVRPLRPEDEPALVAFAAATSPEDIRLRFHGVARALSHDIAARLSQLDYDREMALAAFEADAIVGVARLAFDPNFETGEYAILVRTDMQGRGIGRRLVGALMSYARTRGARALTGDVLAENHNMLDFVRELGGALERDPEMASIVHTRLPL